jgi:hypothetical protein
LFVFIFMFPFMATLGTANPDFVLGVGLGAVTPSEPSAHHDGSSRDDSDDAGIPGARGHPVDHGCQPCQILKYLAICLPQSSQTLRAESLRFGDRRIERRQSQASNQVSLLPPCRGPPTAVI